MYFYKIRDVKDPRRNDYDAGIDIYTCEFSAEYAEAIQEVNNHEVLFSYDVDQKRFYLSIQPHENILIPSGLKTRFPKDVALIIHNKSGVALKKCLDVGACVIDSSYEGEIKINLINTSNDKQRIYFGEKITQGVPLKIDTLPIEVFTSKDKTEEEFYEGHGGNRKSNGFGSTGSF